MVYEIQTIIRLMIETWMIVLWMIVSYPQIMHRRIAGYEMLLWDGTAWCYKIKDTWVQNILVRHFKNGGYKSYR